MKILEVCGEAAEFSPKIFNLPHTRNDFFKGCFHFITDLAHRICNLKFCTFTPEKLLNYSMYSHWEIISWFNFSMSSRTQTGFTFWNIQCSHTQGKNWVFSIFHTLEVNAELFNLRTHKELKKISFFSMSSRRIFFSSDFFQCNKSTGEKLLNASHTGNIC